MAPSFNVPRNLQKDVMASEMAHVFDFTVDDTIRYASDASEQGRGKVVHLKAIVSAVCAGVGSVEEECGYNFPTTRSAPGHD